MKILTIFIIALAVLSFGSVVTFAEDLWSETPGLKNLKTPSVCQRAVQIVKHAAFVPAPVRVGCGILSRMNP